MSKGKILFQLSGSIACYKSCQLLSRLVQDGYEVEVVATKNALRFVGEATLEGLTGKRVHTDTFASGNYMSHIHLIRWADIVVLCPASANTLAKMAGGIADDLVTTLFLAHDFKKPYLVAPAMNTQMYNHPAVQSAMTQLKKWGVSVLDTGSGTLACGEVGEGRLLEPDLIFREIESASSLTPIEKTDRPLKILITSGGTREPIDGVRSIANMSSGRTGAGLADHFHARGHTVTYVHARGSATPVCLKEGIADAEFTTFGELQARLISELSNKNYDVVIHAAAVGDFSVESIEVGGQVMSDRTTKIDSDGEMNLRLKRNPKIVDDLRSTSRNPYITVVAFKLTNTLDEKERLSAINKLSSHASPDFIVHNDLHEIDPAGTRHVARLFAGRNLSHVAEVARAETKAALGSALERLIVEKTQQGASL